MSVNWWICLACCYIAEVLINGTGVAPPAMMHHVATPADRLQHMIDLCQFVIGDLNRETAEYLGKRIVGNVIVLVV